MLIAGPEPGQLWNDGSASFGLGAPGSSVPLPQPAQPGCPLGQPGDNTLDPTLSSATALLLATSPPGSGEGSPTELQKRLSLDSTAGPAGASMAASDSHVPAKAFEPSGLALSASGDMWPIGSAPTISSFPSVPLHPGAQFQPAPFPMMLGGQPPAGYGAPVPAVAPQQVLLPMVPAHGEQLGGGLPAVPHPQQMGGMPLGTWEMAMLAPQWNATQQNQQAGFDLTMPPHALAAAAVQQLQQQQQLAGGYQQAASAPAVCNLAAVAAALPAQEQRPPNGQLAQPASHAAPQGGPCQEQTTTVTREPQAAAAAPAKVKAEIPPGDRAAVAGGSANAEAPGQPVQAQQQQQQQQQEKEAKAARSAPAEAAAPEVAAMDVQQGSGDGAVKQEGAGEADGPEPMQVQQDQQEAGSAEVAAADIKPAPVLPPQPAPAPATAAAAAGQQAAAAGGEVAAGQVEGAASPKPTPAAAAVLSPALDGDDAILAASALKALQGALGLVDPGAATGEAASPGPSPAQPPLMLSMLRQAGGAPAGGAPVAGSPSAHPSAARRRKSAPTKLPWAGAPPALLDQPAGSGPRGVPPLPRGGLHSRKAGSGGSRVTHSDSDWDDQGSGVSSRGGGRGRGGRWGGRGRGRGGGPARSKQASRMGTASEGAAIPEGVRREVGAALAMFSNARGSRRSFTVDPQGTFVKTVLAREVGDCNFIKIPDVYREMLSGHSDRAVFLHRGSGREWELATNQLRLKRWQAEFQLSAGDELVLRSAVDDPEQSASGRTHTPEGLPIVMVEVRRDGVPVEPSDAPLNAAAAPRRYGGAAAAAAAAAADAEPARQWGSGPKRARKPAKGGALGGSESEGEPHGEDGEGAASGGEYDDVSDDMEWKPRPSRRMRVGSRQWGNGAGGGFPADAQGDEGSSGMAMGGPAVKQEGGGYGATVGPAGAGGGAGAGAGAPAEQRLFTTISDSAVPVALRMMFAPLQRKHVEIRVRPPGAPNLDAAPQQQEQPQPQPQPQPQQRQQQQEQQQWGEPRPAAGYAPAPQQPLQQHRPAPQAPGYAYPPPPAAAIQQPLYAQHPQYAQHAQQAQQYAQHPQQVVQQVVQQAVQQAQPQLDKYEAAAYLGSVMEQAGVPAGERASFLAAFLAAFNDPMRKAVLIGMKDAHDAQDYEGVRRWVTIALQE